MEVKFTSDLGELDLSEIRLSVQDNNSKVSDTKFSKFMFPFDLNVTQEFLKNYGDYVSFETAELQNKIPGYLTFEDKVHDAFLFIESIQGFVITAQIDFGFEELPNFDKKLSELPLENFKVPDIHTYSKNIATKKYPETNFNFPRIYTKKYPATNEVWKNFDGYINDLKKDSTEMRRNYIDGTGQIFNVNIIQPCPHSIYLLKTGFEDAGLTLEGDILTDPNLKDRWVFSGTDYFSTLLQKKFGISISAFDYDSVQNVFNVKRATYMKTLDITQNNTYKLLGYAIIGKSYGSNGFIKIFLNNNLIYSFISSTFGLEQINLDLDLNITNASTLRIEVESFFADTLTNNVVQFELVGKVLQEDQDITTGEDLGVITNLNEVNLKKAVPEITFGEYVNVITNWFNYDIEIKDKTVYMNRIQSEELPEPKDFRFMEVPEPRRNLLNKKSFLLKFLELDEPFKKDAMYYDSLGPKLNGAAKEETTIIEINGYAMELKLPKTFGYLTANVMKISDSVVALVEYDGLQDLQNNAKYSPGCDFPELFYNNWEKWLRIRVNGQEYNWQKNCSISKISQYSVKDLIFCYNNTHIIKSINKEKIAPDVYNIELTTETVV